MKYERIKLEDGRQAFVQQSPSITIKIHGQVSHDPISGAEWKSAHKKLKERVKLRKKEK